MLTLERLSGGAVEPFGVLQYAIGLYGRQLPRF